MRIQKTLTTALVIAGSVAAFSTTAAASDVRILTLPSDVHGAWAPSTEACASENKERLDIAARTFSLPDASCEIAWITVTPARDGPAYSARSICTQVRTGQKEPPSYLLITRMPNDTLLVRRAIGYSGSDPVSYRKC
jgi:hypothetical protein